MSIKSDLEAAFAAAKPPPEIYGPLVNPHTGERGYMVFLPVNHPIVCDLLFKDRVAEGLREVERRAAEVAKKFQVDVDRLQASLTYAESAVSISVRRPWDCKDKK